ncbi:DUF3592 domain-containing protein [Roseomonas sp. PWR1]|uniref:DUF3592 domain-containing protein n=1 Tax=Roseomonas nitratireducens TaxID=2820810 RepID=A0ABS4ANM8_9PROT|nr:DUF3592 domain-containing protein [Neoroseomonas nitratireducens]MBP0462969.1 DUF3592 domain-containing protein [Neoroseomonas nitratireducens]
MTTTFSHMGTRRTPGPPRWLGWLFLLLGLLFAAGAGGFVWFEMKFRERSVEVEGRIVQMIQRASNSSGGSRSSTWTPVFAFRLPDGKEVRVEASFSSSPPCCAVGDRVTVRYDPADPVDARMAGFMSDWFLITVFGGMAAVFLLLGGLLLRFAARGGAPVVAGGPAPGAFAGQPMSTPAAAQAGSPPGVATFQVPLIGLRREGAAYILQARWSDPRSGVARFFESVPIPFDPVPQMRQMDSVAIAFDPSQPDGPYMMDLSFLRAPG